LPSRRRPPASFACLRPRLMSNVRRRMPSFRMWWLVLPVPVLAWAAYSALSFDNSNGVAKAVLFGPRTNANDSVISAALQAKFPDGTSDEEVIRFAKELGGVCSKEPTEITTYCGGPPETRPSQCTFQKTDALRCSVQI